MKKILNCLILLKFYQGKVSIFKNTINKIYSRKTAQLKATHATYFFYDYAPYVFYMIRRKNHICNEEYLASIGVDHFISSLIKGNVATMSELISSGKSGCFFYYTVDGKYTLKTIHRQEFYLIRKILNQYFNFLSNNPSTYLTK